MANVLFIRKYDCTDKFVAQNYDITTEIAEQLRRLQAKV